MRGYTVDVYIYIHINIYSPFLTAACLSIQKQCDDNAVMQIINYREYTVHTAQCLRP